MHKLVRLLASLVFSCATILTFSYSEPASAAGCQVLSKNTLEKKAKRYKKTIRSASRRYGVNEDLIKAVITVESCFRRKARGLAGEKGLMQLMPATARRFRVKRGYNAWENIHGGTRYLSHLLKRYKGDKKRAIAAYNAGEGNVKIGRRIRNIGYVNKVMRAYNKLSAGKTSRKNARHNKLRPSSSPRRHSKTYSKQQHFYVKRGHTVYEVMRQTGVPVEQIIRLNNLQKPYHILTGQRLQLK